MKKIIVIIIAMVIGFSILAGNIKLDGYKDVRWGDTKSLVDKSSFGRLVSAGSSGDRSIKKYSNTERTFYFSFKDDKLVLLYYILPTTKEITALETLKDSYPDATFTTEIEESFLGTKTYNIMTLGNTKVKLSGKKNKTTVYISYKNKDVENGVEELNTNTTSLL